MILSLLAVYLLAFTAAQSPDEALLRQLRAHGLTQLTEAYSRKRLADDTLDPAAREAAAVELASTTSLRASTETDAVRRRGGWAESDAVIEPWLRAASGIEPEAYDFRLRHALMIRDRAETAVELLKAVPNDKDLAADAHAQARRAADLLTQLAQEVRKRLNEAAGGDPKKFSRLGDLDIRIDFQTGIAWAVVAYATPGRSERSAAAEQAESRLRTFTRPFSILPLNMEAILTLGKLYLETERLDEAAQLVSVFELHPETPAAFRQRAELLAAQILLAQNKATEALAKLQVSEDKWTPGGEWAVSLFEAMLRGSRHDIDAPKARRDRAIELLASLEKKYGRYWKARGEHVLAKFGGPEVVGDDPRLLFTVASLRRERREWDDAVSMFDRAAKLERASQGAEAGARPALAAAGTLLEKGDSASAAERYSIIAADLAQSPLAADALLGAARSLFPAVKAGDAKAKGAYRNALDQLLALPKIDPAIQHEAAWLRGRVAEEENDLATAAARFREIPAESPRGAAALGALAAVHFKSFLAGADRLAGAQTVAAAVNDLETRLKAIPKSDANGGDRAVAAWVLARLLADYQPERLADAIRLTETTVVVEPTFPQAQNRVWQAVLEWYLRLGDVNGANAAAAKGFANDPKGLSDALLALSPLAEGLSPAEITARAEVGQQAADAWLAKGGPLPDRVRVSFKLVAAEALAAKKEYADAVRILRRLREELPRDRRVAVALARTLSFAGEYRDSLQEWNKLVVGLPQKGQDEWLTAVAEAARCNLELGERAAAARLLKMIETNHTGKGSPAVRRKLAELQKKVER